MNKQIHIFDINRIKLLLVEIFEEEDNDFVDHRKTTPKYNAIDRIIKKISNNKEEQEELWTIISWANDNCVKELEKHGWTIIRGKENYE